jgi:hypothetical protein
MPSAFQIFCEENGFDKYSISKEVMKAFRDSRLKYNSNVKSMRRVLPNRLNKGEWNEIRGAFEYTCALSDSKEVALEHFIPVSWGHGGTTIDNCYPLCSYLNSSKAGHNPFEWIETQPNIDRDKWNDLIFYLATHNGLTVEQYRDFVYWCEDNKRTLDEIRTDKRDSIEIWFEEVFYR